MKIEQRQWTKSEQWIPSDAKLNLNASLVIIFGGTNLLKKNALINEIKKTYPKAHLFGCSTSGEIQGTHVHDNTLMITAIQFESTPIRHAFLKMSNAKDARDAGRKLASMISHQNLRHVLIFSMGLNINGSDLVRGLVSNFPSEVTITGGLAGDQDRFKETIVISGDVIANDGIAIVGLYGDNIEINTASLGGWDPFGPERLVTKSEGNILYELDGKSALEIYKKYLGTYAKELPSSALLFPLSLRDERTNHSGLVRTILGIDEKTQALIFAGDVPMGYYGRFMKANLDRLILGATKAAKSCSVNNPDLAILISCVGRKLILNQRTEEEIEAVRKIFGDNTVLTGFYSYGEISPFTPSAKCELHNQTMTITTLSEKNEEVA